MIPNILTTVRLIIIPFFAYSVLSGKPVWISVSLFLLSGFTDIVDGWIARKFNMITDAGSVYDPLVDKLIPLTFFLSYSFKNFTISTNSTSRSTSSIFSLDVDMITSKTKTTIQGTLL